MSDEFFEKVGTRPAMQREKPSTRTWDLTAEAPQPVVEKQIMIGTGTSWASSGDAFWRIGESHDRLPPGVYRCGVSPNIGPHFMRVKNETDSLVTFPDSESTRILDRARHGQRRDRRRAGRHP